MDRLAYEKDVRNPDLEKTHHRRARFRDGWRNAVVKEEYTEATLKELTWENLGYRLGWLFGKTHKDLIEDMYSWCVKQQKNAQSGTASKEPSTKDPVFRNVLRVVSELHLRGYQRLRIAPGMSPSGLHWRCTITPVTNISSRHGAMLADWDVLTAAYTSGPGDHYFGWTDASHATPSQLADLFISRFPDIVEAGHGSDWVYAGWYVEMLHLTYPNSLPIVYADWDLPEDHIATIGERSHIQIPLPHRGWPLSMKNSVRPGTRVPTS